MGFGGWRLSGLKQDGFYFVIWAIVLPDVLNQTVFAWGWGLVWHVGRNGGLAGQGWAVLFGLDSSFSFSYGACGLVDRHLVLGALVMIFENGLLLSSRLYLLTSPSSGCAFLDLDRLSFGTLGINIIDSVTFPYVTPSVFVNMILTFHCFLTFSFHN